MSMFAGGTGSGRARRIGIRPVQAWVVLLVVFGASAFEARAEGAFVLGSTRSDDGRALARDTAGNPDVVGRFRQTVDFDPGPGEMLLVSNGSVEVFVSSNTGAASVPLLGPLGLTASASRLGWMGWRRARGRAVRGSPARS
jgi:hypothetical protein